MLEFVVASASVICAMHSVVCFGTPHTNETQLDTLLHAFFTSIALEIAICCNRIIIIWEKATVSVHYN
jgi:hypothetical protein